MRLAAGRSTGRRSSSIMPSSPGALLVFLLPSRLRRRMHRSTDLVISRRAIGIEHLSITANFLYIRLPAMLPSTSAKDSDLGRYAFRCRLALPIRTVTDTSPAPLREPTQTHSLRRNVDRLLLHSRGLSPPAFSQFAWSTVAGAIATHPRQPLRLGHHAALSGPEILAQDG